MAGWQDYFSKIALNEEFGSYGSTVMAGRGTGKSVLAQAMSDLEDIKNFTDTGEGWWSFAERSDGWIQVACYADVAGWIHSHPRAQWQTHPKDSQLFEWFWVSPELQTWMKLRW